MAERRPGKAADLRRRTSELAQELATSGAQACRTREFEQLRRLMRCLEERSLSALTSVDDTATLMRHQGRVAALMELREMIFGDE